MSKTLSPIESAIASGQHQEVLRQQFGDQLYDELHGLLRSDRAQPMGFASSAKKTKVLILPGIMGSTLHRRRSFFPDDHIWIDIDDIILGGLTKLAINPASNDVYASGAIEFTYLRMKARLNSYGYDADYLPYDWRLSIPDTGKQLFLDLKRQGLSDIVLVGHSMGGLVARRIAQLDAESGSGLVKKVVTVGTPNYGSYSPVQVFQNDHALLMKVARADLFNTPSDLISKVLRAFPGLVEMMPHPDKRTVNFFDADVWKKSATAPEKDVLQKAIQKVRSLAEVDDRFSQIIGVGLSTIQNATLDTKGVATYTTSLDGDGTVPRDLAEMGSVNRYYIQGEHGSLCNKFAVIRAVHDIIVTGTSSLPEAPEDAQPLTAAAGSTSANVSHEDMRKASDALARKLPKVLKAADLPGLLEGFVSNEADEPQDDADKVSWAAQTNAPQMAVPQMANPQVEGAPADPRGAIRIEQPGQLEGGVSETADGQTGDTPRILNCDVSQGRENDWSLEDAPSAGMLRTAYFPDTVDLRESWWTIGDQGSTGSCVGWATADSVLRWHFVKNGRIQRDQPLSTRFIWMAAKETDEFRHRPTSFIEEAGTSLKAALDVARKLGCVTDDVLSFDRNKVFWGKEKSFYAQAAQLRINSYHNLRKDLTDWRYWLYQNGPILTRLNVDTSFYQATKTNGVLTHYQPTAYGGHAIALVGYTPEGFIVRNSWSTRWGKDGFAIASNAYAQQAFTEAYGVTV